MHQNEVSGQAEGGYNVINYNSALRVTVKKMEVLYEKTIC